MHHDLLGSSVFAIPLESDGSLLTTEEKSDGEQKEAKQRDRPEARHEPTQRLESRTLDGIRTKPVAQKPCPTTESEKKEQRERRDAKCDTAPDSSWWFTVLRRIHQKTESGGFISPHHFKTPPRPCLLGIFFIVCKSPAGPKSAIA